MTTKHWVHSPSTIHLLTQLAEDELVGEKIFVLSELLTDIPQENWIKFSYLPAKAPIMDGNSVGKDLSAEGWKPNYPVICIPGIYLLFYFY